MDPANLNRLSAAALSALTLLLPLPAAARLAKASARASRAAAHPATPVGPSGSSLATGYGADHRYPALEATYVAYAQYPYPPPPYPPPPPPYPYAYPPPRVVPTGPPSVSLTLGADGAVGYRGGAGAFGLGLAVDAYRFGVDTQFTSLYLPVDDGGFALHGHDNIGLFNLFGTVSLVATRDARFRLEAGMMSAFAPGLSTVGPGFGISTLIGTTGPVGFEGMAHVTPYPFREVDAGLGLVLRAGPVGIRGGWRRIWLDDRGLVDSISRQDVFSGPYFGLLFAM